MLRVCCKVRIRTSLKSSRVQMERPDSRVPRSVFHDWRERQDDGRSECTYEDCGGGFGVCGGVVENRDAPSPEVTLCALDTAEESG